MVFTLKPIRCSMVLPRFITDVTWFSLVSLGNTTLHLYCIDGQNLD